MKSEERHHLKENDLEKLLVQLQGFFEKNINLFIWVGVFILAVVVLFFAVNRGPSASDQEAWSALMQANTPEEFGKIANDPEFAGKQVVQLARIQQAGLLYTQGLNLLFSDREGALSDLKQAGEIFQQVYDETADDPQLQEKALYGLACVQETTSNGDLTAALGSYDKLLGFQNSVMLPVYKNRAEKLKSADAQSLYKWMAENPAKPLDRTNPTDGQSANPLENFTIPLEAPEETPAEEETAEEAAEETEEAKEEAAEEKPEAEPAAEAETKAEESTPEQDASSTEKEAEPAAEKDSEAEQPAKPE